MFPDKFLRRMNYLYIFGTILFTVYGQIMLKWRINKIGFSLENGGLVDKALTMLKFMFDPFILSGLVAAFIASMFWMVAMTKFEITHAYPFMSLSPAIVFLLGVFFLNETFTIGKVIGLAIIIVGTIVTVKF